MKRVDWYAKYNNWFQRNRAKLEKRMENDNAVGKAVDLTYQAYRAGWMAARRAQGKSGEQRSPESPK